MVPIIVGIFHRHLLVAGGAEVASDPIRIPCPFATGHAGIHAATTEPVVRHISLLLK